VRPYLSLTPTGSDPGALTSSLVTVDVALWSED
jgi:hypothetical protein